MNYTPVQYTNMLQHVDSSVMDAELHNGRIEKHLDSASEKDLVRLHSMLQDALHIAIGCLSQLETLNENRNKAK